MTGRGRIVSPLHSYLRSISFDIITGGGLSKYLIFFLLLCLILLSFFFDTHHRDEGKRMGTAKIEPSAIAKADRACSFHFPWRKIQFAISFLHHWPYMTPGERCCIDRLDLNAKAAHHSPQRFVFSSPDGMCVIS